MKADMKFEHFYTETDCFWLDQVCRQFYAVAMVIFSMTFFYIVMSKETVPPPEVGYEVRVKSLILRSFMLKAVCDP